MKIEIEIEMMMAHISSIPLQTSSLSSITKGKWRKKKESFLTQIIQPRALMKAVVPMTYYNLRIHMKIEIEIEIMMAHISSTPLQTSISSFSGHHVAHKY